MSNKKFSLNLKTEKAASFVDLETDKSGKSKTSFMNDLFESLADWPTVLTSHIEGSSIFDEIRAIRELLSDELMKKIPRYAKLTRRNCVQMILHLIEKGIEADDQLKLANTQNLYEFQSSTEHFTQENPDTKDSERNVSAATA